MGNMLQDGKTAAMTQPVQGAGLDTHALETFGAGAMDVHAIAAALDRATSAWHTENYAVHDGDNLLGLHRANFDLWHLEDSARDPAATPERIAGVKRGIDRVNQGRNDFVEAIDTGLMESLNAQGLPRPDAPLHSETPGQMLDRLSILSLKRFHTAEESRRTSADEAHRQRNRDRLEVLDRQSADLAGCLYDLWRAVLGGERRIKLYRQFKMYNDGSLNPVLYRSGNAGVKGNGG